MGSYHAGLFPFYGFLPPLLRGVIRPIKCRAHAARRKALPQNRRGMLLTRVAFPSSPWTGSIDTGLALIMGKAAFAPARQIRQGPLSRTWIRRSPRHLHAWSRRASD